MDPSAPGELLVAPLAAWEDVSSYLLASSSHASCSEESRWSGIGKPVIMVKHLFHTVNVGHTGWPNVMSKV